MSKAIEIAVRLLARREHSARELTLKLSQRGIDKADIAITLEECQRLHLQDDLRFAQMQCRTRFQQGYGPLRIREFLRTHVDRDMIAQVLSSYTEEDWLMSARHVLDKKYAATDTHFSDVLKQKQFLVYRGFSPDMITRLLRMVIGT